MKQIERKITDLIKEKLKDTDTMPKSSDNHKNQKSLDFEYGYNPLNMTY